MSGSLGAIDRDVTFDFATCDALVSAFNAAAAEINGQAPTRASYVATAEKDFSGYFAQLFAQNAATAAGDGADLVVALQQTATYADELAGQARAENKRRKIARDYMARHDDWWEKVGDWLFDPDGNPPVGPPDEPLTKPVEAPRNRERQPLVGSGACGGVSSARPENLTTFAVGSAQLNSDLSGLDTKLRSHLNDFTTRCTYGTLSAEGVVTSLGKWLEANGNDVTWANDVANAFAAAGGTGGVDTLSNAALEAVLAAAGVNQVRADLDIAMPSAMGGAPTNGYTMDPVNTATGNFVEPEVDLAFTGGAGSLALSRMYNSVDTRTGVFGPGWSSILEVALDLGVEGARWRMADGRGVFFPRHDTGWERAVGENYWLAREATPDIPGFSDAGQLAAGEVLMVRDNGGAWWAFTPSGTWLGSGHGPGTTITVRRDEQDRVTGLAHARGRSLDVTYADGRVASVTACDGRQVTYTYDDAGQLTSVRSPAGERCYRWNDQGRIEAVVSAAGVVEATNTYDAKGRVTCQTSPFGREVHFSYLPGQITQVSDADGTRSNTWLADAKGRLIGVIDSAGNRQSMSWDHWGNLVTVTERDRATTVHSYDERGRRTRTTRPGGAVITYTYDDLDRITTETTTAARAAAVASTQATSESDRGAESTISYEYATDTDRDPHLIIDALGGRTELTWTGGLLTRVVDPAGVAVDLDYDTHGDLIAATNAAGDTMRITRDEAGRIVQVTTPAGHATAYTYDQAGNLATRTDPDGATWGFEHTGAGQLSVIIDPTGARTELEYGPHGQLVRTIDPLGRVIEQDFDDLGNLATVHLPDGATWTYTHDALSRLTAVTDPAGGTWMRQYGPGGDLWATIDPTGVRHSQTLDRQDGTARLTNALATTTIQFDKLGHLIQTQTPDGSVEQVTYDPCGNPIELLDAEGGRTTLGRDAAGRIVSITTPTGAVSRIDYDACGRPRTLTDPTGATTTLAYDADSHLIARTFPTGEVETFTYDPCGRLTSHVVPGGGIARYRYDKAGRITTIRDTWNGTRGFTYDSAGQLIATVNGLGGRTVYDYDARGRLIQITDPLGAITTYTYDQCDNPTSLTDPLGRTTSATYDGAGRLSCRTDPDGHATTWTYDRAGRTESVTVDGRIISTTTRDPKTRRVTVVDHTDPSRELEHVLEFNRRGQLIRRSRDGQALRWEYDADGSRTAFTGPDGVPTTYTHDAAGRVIEVNDPGLDRAIFAYDATGRLTRAQAGPLTQTWTYDGGFLTQHSRTQSDTTQTTRIQRDAEGQITALDQDGARTSYNYDAAGELIAAITTGDDGSSSAHRWHFDQAGHLSTEHTPTGTIGYHYDLASQLLTIEGPEDQIRFAYDGLGRRIHANSSDGHRRDYAWSPLGNLARITTTGPDGASSEHVLHVDALGELAAIDDTDLWWDTAEPLPTLTAIGRTGILPLATGLTGIGNTWTASGWRTDHATTGDDPWWAMIDTRSPEPGTGPASPNLLPAGIGLTRTGGLTVAGLHWLGVRTYDPATRGFLSTDPLPPIPGTTWAANPYAYAANNPLALTDPTGCRPATDQDLKNWTNDHKSHWQEALMGALTVATVVVAIFPVPGHLAVSGALEVAAEALDAAVGGADALDTTMAAADTLTSVARTAASATTRMGHAVADTAAAATRALTPIAKAAAPTATRMGIHGAVGGATSAGTYAVTHVGHENGRELMATTVTGATTAAIGSLIDPAAGTISSKLGNSEIKWVTQHSRTLTGATKGAMGFAVSGTGSVMQSNLAGTDTDPRNVIATAASGAGSTYISTERAQKTFNLPTNGISGQWVGAAIDSGVDTAAEVLRKFLGFD